MFNQPGKIMLTVLALPLMISFLARDCAHQKRNINGQPDEAKSKMGEAKSQMDNAMIGGWGGEHISLDVTPEGGRVEYDCAHGTIDQKVVLDGQGRFDLSGTHVREHGGPVRKDEPADSHPARFTGQVKGETMTLTVTENDTKEIVGTFTLVHGQKPQVVKCR
jgi:hypothetical protein